MIAESRALIEIRDLTIEYRVPARDWRASAPMLRAVDGVSLDIGRGETLGLVGESGCGKSTLGRTMLGLHRPAHGSVSFDGVNLSSLGGEDLRRFRRRAQMVFQDPYASLNPRMKVEQIVGEPLNAHGVGSRAERRQRVRTLLERVGLTEDAANAFPSAFSGGQRQRIGIARALALEPELLVADEPVSALDVSIQAQIVNLLRDLQEELGLTLLMIAHDLAVVRHMAPRVVVLYLGQVMESGPTQRVLERPLHPYTEALVSAVPYPDPPRERRRQRIVLRGDVPSPIDPPSGCRFQTRCPKAMPVCRTVTPLPLPTDDERVVACHLVHPEPPVSRTTRPG